MINDKSLNRHSSIVTRPSKNEGRKTKDDILSNRQAVEPRHPKAETNDALSWLGCALPGTVCRAPKAHNVSNRRWEKEMEKIHRHPVGMALSVEEQRERNRRMSTKHPPALQGLNFCAKMKD